MAERSEIRRGDLRLIDLAPGPWPDAVRGALEAVRLGRAPLFGETRRLPRSLLAAGFRRASFASGIELRARLPAEVSVTRAGGVADRGRLGHDAQNRLSERLARECENHAATALDEPRESWLPPDDVRREQWRIPSPLSGRMVAWVDIFENGSLYRSIPYWFRVSCQVPAFRLNTTVGEGETLGSPSVRSESVDLAALAPGERPVRVLRDAVARRTLAEGRLLLEEDIMAAPAVRKNSLVQLRVVSGSVELELTGTALTDGAIGEVIWVRSGLGGELLRIKVTDKDNGVAI
ncbi:flagellar basal body P-ring formation chaperone FlgA [Paludibacterium paludis]|uniref:Flagella basal body P-ring formation protein FlgA SAF domain-containing protein n=1 Tax=Paludibacterium paludis TaxID=1225769 RepID=A0A918P6N0_9NEIS|nr:flagellar basal body P-ring formation chaperone FlgA [Paludibacterium paludis]GGY28799.1 hypothetical protein GCM10011289_34960 [Paludibacterium paludis]